jgi:hypothetical protein
MLEAEGFGFENGVTLLIVNNISFFRCKVRVMR